MTTAVRIALRRELAAHADPQRAEGAQRYMKSAMPFLGVRVPTVRAIVAAVLAEPTLRPTSREEWQQDIRELWDGAQYREERYAALAVLRHRFAAPWRTSEVMPLVEDLIVTGAWWDLVDEISHVVGAILLTDPEGEGGRLRTWARGESRHGDDLWLRRSAIIAQLGAKERTDRDLLADVIEINLARREFFITKAIGWALRQYARTDPQWVVAFVEHHDLAPLSRREALKHLDTKDEP